MSDLVGNPKDWFSGNMTHYSSYLALAFQTDQELDVTITRQNKTEAKSSEAIQKAESERGHIKHELDTVKDALSNIKLVL